MEFPAVSISESSKKIMTFHIFTPSNVRGRSNQRIMNECKISGVRLHIILYLCIFTERFPKFLHKNLWGARILYFEGTL